jgi:hypothetical protein
MRHPNISGYLEALGTLCIETSRNPKLLPVFIAVLRLVPRTITELERAERLAA